MRTAVFRAGLWLAIGVALGRLAGFFREAILAARFGRTAEGDAAVLVLTLPDTVINLLVGSAMTVALIPPLAALRPLGGDRALVRQALVVGGLAGIGLWLGLAAAGVSLVTLLAPKLPPAAAAAVAGVLPIALAAIPAAVLSSVLGAALQERYRTATTALGTLLFNGAVIAGLLLAGPGATLAALAVAMVVGAGLRCGLQAWDYRRDGPLPSTPAPATPGLVRAYVQALLAGAAILLVPVLGRAFASQAGEGEIAAYTYACKLFELPLGVALTVVAQALFAKLSALRSEGKEAEARTLLGQGLMIVMLLSGVCAGVLAGAGPILAEAAFARGRMAVADAHHIGALAAWLALALPAAAVASLVVGWRNAGRDTRSPLVAGLIGLAVFTLVAVGGQHSWGIQAVVGATVALHITVMGWLMWVARNEVPWTPGILLPGVVAAVLAWGASMMIPAEAGIITRLALAVAAGAVALAGGGIMVPTVRARLRRR